MNYRTRTSEQITRAPLKLKCLSNVVEDRLKKPKLPTVQNGKEVQIIEHPSHFGDAHVQTRLVIYATPQALIHIIHQHHGSQ